MKKIVVDSSSLITLSENCMLKTLEGVREREGASFIMPESVYEETVKTPLKIRRFEFNAIKIRNAVRKGILKVAKTTPAVKKTMKELSGITANICAADGRLLTLINRGEAETLALMKETGTRILLIDERTTRMLIEEPQNVMRFLEKRHRCSITLNTANLDSFRKFFSEIKIVRSVELIALAYENGSFELEMEKSREALEAALFAAKYSGCAVSAREILAYMKGVKA